MGRLVGRSAIFVARATGVDSSAILASAQIRSVKFRRGVKMRKILLPVCLAMLIAGPAFAEQSGAINGVVAGASGGVGPGAPVRATETPTGLVTTTVTGTNGRYSFPSLRPTEYSISAEIS